MGDRRAPGPTSDIAESERDLALFLSLANHDLQAPLRTLRSFVELAAEENPSPFLDEAVAIAHRLQGLIRATLTYGRLHRHRLRLRSIPLADAVAVGMDRVGVELVERGAEIHIAPDLPAVLADRALLGMSIEAVLDNATRFVDPDRQPRLSIDAQPAAAGTRVRLRIHDNGVGIAPGDRERCFEPAVRLASPGRSVGHGFGLAIVRRALGMMDGTCGLADTANGHGIQVWLELPAVPVDHLEPEPVTDA